MSDHPERPRPSKMENVPFPPAKYGLWIAIILIILVLLVSFSGITNA